MTISAKKLESSIANARLGTLARQRRIEARAPWCCVNCSITKTATVHQMRKTYCSNACMAAHYRVRLRGAANPHYKAAAERHCEQCGGIYRSYNKTRKFCSRRCFQLAEVPVRSRARKDHNHNEVVAAFEAAGGKAIDTSHMGHGFPDFIGFTKAGIQLAEIKNPQTAYGRRGLNKRQQRFVATLPAPIYILHTAEDAIKFAQGRLDELEKRTPEEAAVLAAVGKEALK